MTRKTDPSSCKSIGSRPTPIKSRFPGRPAYLSSFLLLVRPLDFPGADFFVRSGQLLVDRPMAGIDQHAVEGFLGKIPGVTEGGPEYLSAPLVFPSPRHGAGFLTVYLNDAVVFHQPVPAYPSSDGQGMHPDSNPGKVERSGGDPLGFGHVFHDRMRTVFGDGLDIGGSTLVYGVWGAEGPPSEIVVPLESWVFLCVFEGVIGGA